MPSNLQVSSRCEILIPLVEICTSLIKSKRYRSKHKYADSILEEGTNLNPVILFTLLTMYSVTRLFQYVRKVLYPQEEFIRNTSVNNPPVRDTGSFPDYLFTERLGNL